MSSAAATTDAYREIALDESRLTDCLALSSEAGWNQVAADWRLMLDRGRGIGLVRPDGRLVASALLLPLGPRLAWIGMVLVTVAERRRGLASRLMRRCLAMTAADGAAAGLDATPAGRSVYGRLGFAELGELIRLQGVAPTPWAPAPDTAIRRLCDADLPALIAYDRLAFGAERGAVLANLLERASDAAFLAESGSRIAGYVLARDGRNATQIGPVVAETPKLATDLIAAAMSRVDGPVFVDLFRRHDAIESALARWGFTPQRPFYRMLAGAEACFHDADRYVLSAGPELA